MAARPQPKLAATRDAPRAGPTPTADQARALLAVLEGGADAAPPNARLRDLAAQLVAQVEMPAARPPAAPKRDLTPVPKSPSGPSRLFRHANPFHQAPKPTPPRAQAPVAAPPPVAPIAATQDADPVPRETRLSSPPAASQATWITPRADIRAMADKAVDPTHLGQEHPVIAALMLAGRPPAEQSAALRRLPQGSIRVTHRHMIALEATPHAD